MGLSSGLCLLLPQLLCSPSVWWVPSSLMSVVAKMSPELFLTSSLSLLQVPFTYIEYDSNARIWPGVRQAYELVDRYQLVNSYGLFRRMTGVSGRPEVVIEGSYDAVSWTVSGRLFVTAHSHPNHMSSRALD